MLFDMGLRVIGGKWNGGGGVEGEEREEVGGLGGGGLELGEG